MRSIRRHLVFWVIGALSVGSILLVSLAFLLTLDEMNEVLDDNLNQMADLMANLAPLTQMRPEDSLVRRTPSTPDTEDSGLVMMALRPDGSLIFTTDAKFTMPAHIEAGARERFIDGKRWHSFTVIRSDRIIQVAQPARAREDMAAEAALQLLLPASGLVGLIGLLLTVALRRGLLPLATAARQLAERGETSLEPIDEKDMPPEIHPLVRAMNGLLGRVANTFELQRRFVADAAHELRSPVTALQLQLSVLEQSHGDVDRQLAIEELRLGIARSRRLIIQLLQLSRAEPSNSEFVKVAVSLGDLVRATVGSLSPEAERRQIDLGADLKCEATVMGDAEQLSVLLNNLVENALQYTPSGGVVDVIVMRIDGHPVLQVIDSGPGIPEADRERVFDRFYRRSGHSRDAQLQGNSGLGLSIVRTIARRHSARVSLADAPRGTGLDVRVTFKASTEADERTALSSRSSY